MKWVILFGLLLVCGISFAKKSETYEVTYDDEEDVLTDDDDDENDLEDPGYYRQGYCHNECSTKCTHICRKGSCRKIKMCKLGRYDGRIKMKCQGRIKCTPVRCYKSCRPSCKLVCPPRRHYGDEEE